MTRLKLEQWGTRWSFARGATKATHRAEGQSITELTEALAEVDGLLAGINYLDRLEPESDEDHSLSNRSDNASNPMPQYSANGSWFGHLTVDLPQLETSASEERSKIEIRHLRNILNDKLISSNDNSRQKPRKSQWATLRSLRKASKYHYNQFTKVTADSTSADIRKLRKSYVTAKDMLEMGILTFRDVLYGHNPTTLVDIFAFASLSYVISKILHSNGHIDESDILSGILDWRAAITDERERSTFVDIAKRLWPEAKEIMHFFPIETKERSPEIAELRRDESETRWPPSPIPQEGMDAESLRPDEEYIIPREDPLLSPWAQEYPSILQANTFPMPNPIEMQNPPGELQDQIHRLVQETKSHEEYMFSSWLNLEDTLPEDFMDSSLYQSTAPDIGYEVLDPSQTGCSIGTESVSSESPSPRIQGSEEPCPAEPIHLPADDSTLHHLLNTPLFQAVCRFVDQISEVGDLLNVLSGRGLTSGKDDIKSSHPRQPWLTLEFLDQAPKHFFVPLQRKAVQIDEICSGIIAMAEMFVRVGSLHTVREVENYIIAVGRSLARSPELFGNLVSKTLIQCLFASQKMKWNLLYPNYIQEADEYSIEYINRRERGEKEWADPDPPRLDPSEEMSSPSSSTNENPQKRSSKVPRYLSKDSSDSAPKRRRRYNANVVTHSPPSGSDVSTIVHCRFNGCSKSFTGSAARNNLSRHVRTEHHKKTLKCPKCDKETRRRDNLRQHFLKIHSTCTLPDWIADKRRGLRDASSVE